MTRGKLKLSSFDIDKRFESKEEAIKYAKRLREFIRYNCKKRNWSAQAIICVSNIKGNSSFIYFEQNGKLQFLPKEDWIIVEGTHEPLITQEQFDAVAVMAEESRKRHVQQMEVHRDIPHTENSLRKKIFCGQCDSLMTRRSRVKNGKRDYCYFCNAPKSKIGVHCANTHIHEIPLMEAVTEATDRQLRLLGKIENHWGRQKQSEDYKKKEKDIENQKKDLEEAVNRIKILRQEIYADMKEGLLSPADYEYEKNVWKKSWKSMTLR